MSEATCRYCGTPRSEDFDLGAICTNRIFEPAPHVWVNEAGELIEPQVGPEIDIESWMNEMDADLDEAAEVITADTYDDVLASIWGDEKAEKTMETPE
jgi:hypothetical protein